MSFSVITNSNLPAKEGSRGWLGDRGSVSLLHLSGSMPSNFIWHFMSHSKKLIKKKRFIQFEHVFFRFVFFCL